MKKKVALKDGTELTVKKLALKDLDSLMDFYVSLPKNDRKYLRIDVTDKELVRNRISDAVNKKDIRLAVNIGAQIIATGALEFSPDDWRKNFAELRLIVARKFQHRGVGLMLARELYCQAAENGVKKLVVKMMKPQTNAQNMVRKLGFSKKGTIPDYVIDQFGKSQDLVIMTCDMKNFWKEMEQDYSDSDWRRCR